MYSWEMKSLSLQKSKHIGEIMIRQLRKKEVKTASDLGDSIYPDELGESLKSFENKFLFYPEGFLGYFVGKKLIGYIIGHPWKGEKVVPLDYLGKFPKNPDCFYVHDVAVNPSYRGKGYGKELVKNIIIVGKKKGFKKFMFVAVNEIVRTLCENHGFVKVADILYGHNVKSYKMMLNI